MVATGIVAPTVAGAETRVAAATEASVVAAAAAHPYSFEETPQRCRDHPENSRCATSQAVASCRDKPHRSERRRTRDRSCHGCGYYSTTTLQLHHHRRSVPLIDPHAPYGGCMRGYREDAKHNNHAPTNYITLSETTFIAISGKVTFRPGKYIVIGLSTACGFSRARRACIAISDLYTSNLGIMA
jgi:hypothetical protein